MAFLCVYFPSVPYFSVGLKKSLNYTLEILIYDVKDYIRHFSNAFFIVISGIVFKIWRVRFFFPLLKTNGFSKQSWLYLPVIVRAGQQPVFGHHHNEALFCLGCWRNPSVLCLLPHIPSRQRTCCCEGTFLHWTWVSWGFPYCQAPSSSDKGHDTALLTLSC